EREKGMVMSIEIKKMKFIVLLLVVSFVNSSFAVISAEEGETVYFASEENGCGFSFLDKGIHQYPDIQYVFVKEEVSGEFLPAILASSVPRKVESNPDVYIQKEVHVEHGKASHSITIEAFLGGSPRVDRFEVTRPRYVGFSSSTLACEGVQKVSEEVYSQITN
ncbi:MAG: hypothetical protein AAF202_08520, partial [Pseudomonadota bacterium]